jgi:hypothetical protein
VGRWASPPILEFHEDVDQDLIGRPLGRHQVDPRLGGYLHGHENSARFWGTFVSIQRRFVAPWGTWNTCVRRWGLGVWSRQGPEIVLDERRHAP